MDDSLATHYLGDVIRTFRGQKRLAEKALEQAGDADLFSTLDPEANSIAIVVKHMAGNMRSRWTDFLTSDGEKPDRDRDGEFIVEPATRRETVMRWWDDGWRSVFAALEPLRPSDLMRRVLIRGESMSVVEAINRQISHYAYHVGQIVLLVKHAKSEGWRSLSIPRGQSAEYLSRPPESAPR